MEANLWSDEQKSHKATVKDKVAVQTEVNNFTRITVVDVADRWRRNVWYLGGHPSRWETEAEVCSNNEWREVSRGHSTIVVANMSEEGTEL